MSKRNINILIISVVAVLVIMGIFVAIWNTQKAVKVAPREAKRVTLRAAAPPDPNFIPLFIMLSQKTLAKQGIDLEFVPAEGLNRMIDILKKGGTDIAIFSIPHGAKLYAKGLKTLRLVGVHVWKAIYVVAAQNVSGWKDLVGKKVLIAFKGAPPDIIARDSMKSSGYSPDKDFKIEYSSAPDILKLLLSGKANAAVVPEPWVSQLILKSGGKLKMAIDPQKGFTKLVPECQEGEIPMGGLWVVVPNVTNKKEAVKKFVTEFDKANDYAMSHPQEAGKITSEYFLKYFHKQLSPKVIAYSLSNNLLELDFRSIKYVKPILSTCLKAFKFPVPSEGIYYQGL